MLGRRVEEDDRLNRIVGYSMNERVYWLLANTADSDPTFWGPRFSDAWVFCALD